MNNSTMASSKKSDTWLRAGVQWPTLSVSDCSNVLSAMILGRSACRGEQSCKAFPVEV